MRICPECDRVEWSGGRLCRNCLANGMLRYAVDVVEDDDDDEEDEEDE